MTLTLTALPLQISARVTNPIHLNEHKGSAIRGALFHALRKRSCARLELASCHPCELVPVCPISALVATVDPEWDRGADPPRPLVVEPPLDPRTEYRSGDCLEFGLTVFGSAGRLLPYLVLAVGDAGKAGLGRRYQRDGLWTDGRFEVERIELASPFCEESEVLYPAGEGQAIFRSPRKAVTDADVQAALEPTADTVTLDFVTPTRLISRGERLPTFELAPFLQRLRERLEALESRYGQARVTEPLFDAAAIAAELRVTTDSTRWCDVRSFSHRQKQAMPVGGFVGSVTLSGNLAPVLPFLAWGQLTHVGKNATKGNGAYRLRFQPA
ncbi:MAG TPA: CRISPR system precrRNA processing endoribonuclease RAMP protein Cas6 [Chloroflexota bacterium]|nr:CRISPR system precrRNA processing endoribonuclease RAMP protein Cas6 [Chloroflexota bacterium]